MKVKVKTKELLDAIRQLTSIVSVKKMATIPILKTVKLCVVASKLRLTTVDEDVSLRAEKSIDAESSEDGEIGVDARLLQKIASKLPDKEISLSTNPGLKLTAGAKSFDIYSIMNTIDFPSAEKSAAVNKFSVKREDFIRALKYTTQTVSLDDTRRVLHGIFVENDKREITSTNCKCLVTTNLKSTSPSQFAFVLPLKTATLALKMFKKGSEHISFKVLKNNRIVMVSDDCQIISKTIDGTYPTYRQVIPDSYKYEVSVPLKDFRQNIDMILNLAGQCSYFQLEADDNNLYMSINTNSFVSSSVKFGSSIPVEYQGDIVSTNLNPYFIMQAIKNLKVEELKLHFTSGLSPVGISADNGFTFVIMPMRGR